MDFTFEMCYTRFVQKITEHFDLQGAEKRSACAHLNALNWEKICNRFGEKSNTMKNKHGRVQPYIEINIIN